MNDNNQHHINYTILYTHTHTPPIGRGEERVEGEIERK